MDTAGDGTGRSFEGLQTGRFGRQVSTSEWSATVMGGRGFRMGRIALAVVALWLPCVAAGAQSRVAAAADGPGRTETAGERSAAARDMLPGPKPLSVFTDATGRTCHLYARAVMIGNETETAYATICRQPSGRWVLVQ